MKCFKSRQSWIISILGLICLIPIIANAQPIKTTVAEILANPDNFDGKMVSVEGKVVALQKKISNKGNSYATFKLFRENRTIRIFSFGKPSVKDGDSAKVIGRYQKMKHSGQFTFNNEIETSDGRVEAIK
jgi:hypothetical protein